MVVEAEVQRALNTLAVAVAEAAVTLFEREGEIVGGRDASQDRGGHEPGEEDRNETRHCNFFKESGGTNE